MPETVQVSDVLRVLGRSDFAGRPGGKLGVAPAPRVFIEPLLHVGGGDPSLGGADVVVVRAPAAVGKSTLAAHLSSEANAPLLDLSDVRVSTGSLPGLFVSSTSDPGAFASFRAGQLPVVVDALDEGVLLSREDHFDAFWDSTWDLLDDDGPTASGRPKLVLLGRGHTLARLLEQLVELHPRIRAVVLDVAYFGEAAARRLVERTAESDPQKEPAFDTFRAAALDVIDKYFVQIARALNVTRDQLFVDEDARAFAGYAPVLASLARLLASTRNYPQLSARLERDTTGDAWAVIEDLGDYVVERERVDKVVPQLQAFMGEVEVPEQAYDTREQVRLIVGLLTGDSAPGPSHAVFTDGDHEREYRRLCEQFIGDHPFVSPAGGFANSVLGALTLSRALRLELLDDTQPLRERLAAAAALPFMWRSVSASPSQGTPFVHGGHLALVLASLRVDEQRDAVAGGALEDHPLRSHRVTLEALDETEARASVEDGQGASWEFGVLGPLELCSPVVATTVIAPDRVLSLRGLGEADASRFLVRDSTFAVQTLDVRAGVLECEGRVVVDAVSSTAVRDLRLRFAGDAEVTVSHTLYDAYPWRTSSARRLPAALDPVQQLLLECSTRLAGAGPISLAAGTFRVVDDHRLTWASRDFPTLFPRLMGVLQDTGWLQVRSADAAGAVPLVRVSPRRGWSHIFDLATTEDPVGEASELQEALAVLK